MSRRFIFRYTLIALWMALIFWFSAHNAAQSTEQSSAILEQLHNRGATWLTVHDVRKLAHILLYLVLGMLLHSATRQYKLSHRYQIGIALLAAAIYACTDELHQMFITGRSSEIRDVIIDTIGAGMGIGIYQIIVRQRLRAGRAGRSAS